MSEIFDRHKVLICGGSGGVGKTTVSAALAVKAAQRGQRVLVLTIDPARRLATALGLADSVEKTVEVPGQEYSGKLYAEMIDPQSIFEKFVRRSAKDNQSAQNLLQNRLYQQMVTTLSGSQEFTSLEELLSAKESNAYDLVILDTPPTQHAIDFLQAPEKIYSLFQESVTQWFVQDKKKSTGWFRQVLNRSTKTVLGALEKVTGNEFIHELSDFFQNAASLQERVRERSVAVHRLLTSDETGFVLVTAFDGIKIYEAGQFYQELNKGGYHLLSILVNRAFPEWDQLTTQSLGSELEQDTNFQELLDFYQKMRSYHRSEGELKTSLRQWVGNEIPILAVPEVAGQIEGLSGLEKVAETITLNGPPS